MAEKSVITSLETRMRALIEEHRRLGAQCRELVAERDALRAENRSLEERAKRLQEELGRMRLAEGLSGGGGDREKARARVNRLMREVDRCIALVGTLEEEAARAQRSETK